MRIKIILLLILSLCFQSSIFAKEKASVPDRIIGSTFKTLAKAFVATTDINKLKKNYIDKLNKMDNEKFKKRYAKVYETLKDLPPHLKAKYGISENMTKEQAIKNIESFDNKKKMYKIIDSIPDTFIVYHFKQYLSKTKQEIQKTNLVEQIKNFWNKMIEKMERK